MSEKATLWIVVNDGNVFEGSEIQFAQEFFIKPTKSAISSLCRKNEWTVKFTNLARARHRRKTPKTSKILKNHSSVRAAQRYALYLDDETRAHILQLIKTNVNTDECRAIERQSCSRTLFRVIIGDKVCGVVYDKPRHEIVTFIPPNDPKLATPVKKKEK